MNTLRFPPQGQTCQSSHVQVRKSPAARADVGIFCSEMEGAFFDHVGQTAEALLPLISCSEEAMLLDDARSTALHCWAMLIKSARMGAEARGQQGSTLHVQLLQTFLQKVFVHFSQDDNDAEALKDCADGIAECLKNVGQYALGSQEVAQLVQQLFKFIDASFQRTVRIQKAKGDEPGAPASFRGTRMTTTMTKW